MSPRPSFVLWVLGFLVTWSSLGAETARAQLDTRHWIPPLWSLNGTDAGVVGDHWVYISTPEVEPVTFTIKDGAGNSHTGVVSNTSPVGLHVAKLSGTVIANTTGGWAGTHTPHLVTGTAKLNVKLSDGLVVEAERPVYVSVRQKSGSQGEISASPGRKGLGTEFRALFAYNVKSTNTWRGSFISVMSSEPGTTTVSIAVRPGVKLYGLPDANNDGATDTHTITLNQYESYIVGLQDTAYTGTAPIANLNGTLVTSDKLIAVTSGYFLGGPTDASGQDAGFDQLVPTELAGTEFVMIKGNAANTSVLETVTVVATENGTDLYVKGETTPYNTTPLNAGEHAFIQGQYIGDGLYLRASKPVLVVQGIGGSDSLATSGANVIPPIGVDVSNFVDNIPVVNFYGTATIGIVSRAGATVTLNGAAPSVAPQPITGAPDWVTYKITGMTGTVSVVSNAAVAVSLINVSGVAGLAGYFSGFPSSATLDLDGDDTADGGDNCPDDPNLDQLDDDGDGIGNLCDQCDDDPQKALPGVCGCGTPDKDYDLDGVTCTDNCPYDANANQADADGAGIGDACADDLDNDGVLNEQDGCPLDAKKSAPGFCGCGFLETDSDLDGSPNCVDACPLNPSKTSAGACGCAAAETDSDGDGVPDCVDVCGNGAVDAGEDCDDANASNADACTSQCFWRPSGAADNMSVAEDGVAVIDVMANDLAESGGRVFDVVIVTEPAHGVAIVEADGRVTYVPDPDFAGMDGFTYQLADEVSVSDLVTVTLTVTAVNDAPTLSVLSDVTLDEDGSTVVPVVVGDIETATGSLTVTATSSNVGVVTVSVGGAGANRTVSVVGVADASGTSTITVSVSDGVATTSRTFVATVTAVNDAPVVSSFEAQVLAEEGSTSVPFTVSDVDDATLSVSASVLPTDLVSVSLVGSGAERTLVLTGLSNVHGEAEVTVSVTDGTSTVTRTFLVTVTAVNDAPVALGEQVVVVEGAMANGIVGGGSLLANDVDADGDTLVVEVVTNPAHGSLSVSADGTFAYTHDGSETSSDTFSYRVGDGALWSNTVSVEVSVTAVNDAPTVGVIADQAWSEDGSSGPLAFAVEDADSGALTVTATSSNPTLLPAEGLVLGGDGGTRTITLSSAPDTHGEATMTVSVSDGEHTVSRTFAVTVGPVNDAPSLAAIADQAGLEDGTLSVELEVGDRDSAPGELVVTATSSDPELVSGLVVSAGPSAAMRTLALAFGADRHGTATLTVVVSDGEHTATRTFGLSVGAVNDAPVGASDAVLVMEGGTSRQLTSGAASVLSNDNDVDGDVLVASLVSGPSHGTLTLSADGTFEYVHDGSETESDAFVYRLSDGAIEREMTVSIAITPINNAPVAVADQAAVAEGGTLSGQVLDNDTDAESQALSALIVAQPQHGELTLAADGSFTYRHDGSETTADSFTYVAFDGLAQSEPTTVAVSVTPVNDAPTLAFSGASELELVEDEVSGELVFVVSDAETEPDALTVVATSGDESLIPNVGLVFGGVGGTRTLVLRPAPDMFGTTTVTVVVSDGELSAELVLEVTVVASDDAPTLGAVADVELAEDGSADVELEVADVDSEGLEITATSSAPELVAVAVSGQSLVLTAGTDRVGEAIITVTVHDGVNSTTRTFFVRISGLNDAPVGAVDRLTVDEGGRTSGLEGGHASVLANDSDADQDTLSAMVVSPPAHGVLTMAADGTFEYVHDGSETTSDGFVYRAFDGALGVEVEVAIVVRPVNDAPTVSQLEDLVLVEDTESPAISFSIADAETEPSALRVSASTDRDDLIAELVLAGDAGERSLVVRPVADQSGTAEVVVVVEDGERSTEARFEVVIVADNDRPTIGAIEDQRIDEDGATKGIAVLVGDAETDPASLAVTAESDNAELVDVAGLVLSGEGAERTLTVTPRPNASGEATVIVRVRDGVDTAETSFVLSVDAVNDAPTLSAPATHNAIEDVTSRLGAVLVDDIDAGAGLMTAVVEVERGTVRVAAVSGLSFADAPSGSRVAFSGTLPAIAGALGALEYTGPADGVGADRVSISVDDGGHGGSGGSRSASAEVAVVIAAVNDGPQVGAIEDLELTDPESRSVALMLADKDDVPSLLTVSLTTSDAEVISLDQLELQGMGASRELVVSSGGVPGASTVTVIVSDPSGLTSSVSFVVTVDCEDVDGDRRCDVEVGDTDGDGLSDERERELGTDPEQADTDGDGLPDGEELERETDPSAADTDGDGVPDGEELERGLNPLEAWDGVGLTGGGGCSGGSSGPWAPIFGLCFAVLCVSRRRWAR